MFEYSRCWNTWQTRSCFNVIRRTKKDETIDAYVFIDGTRKIEPNFLTLANVALKKLMQLQGKSISIEKTLILSTELKPFTKISSELL